MKISVRHIPNTFNYGSLMMAVNTLSYLHKNLNEVEFFVDCRSEEDLERLKKETGIKNIQLAPNYDIKANNVLTKIYKKLKVSSIEREFYDMKIVLGGDDISEYYGKKVWLIGFPIMFVENSKLPTILLGQTIGPFTSYRRILARIALNTCTIYTRDDKCLKYLKQLGVKTVRSGRDLAFLPLPMQNRAKCIMDTYSLIPENYVTVVVSGLVKCYTNNEEYYLKEQYRIINKILSNDRLKDKKVVILAHVKDTGTADRTIIEKLEKRLTNEEKKRIIAIKEDMLASEAREILGQGLFTITGRMHAAVSTFYMRKPAISLSYSVKYEGVIGSGLDMNELVIECASEELWEKGKVSERVGEKLEYILDHYEELRCKIDKNISRTTKMSIKQLESVLQDIKIIQGKRKKHR